MIGLGDPWVAAAYYLCIISALLCAVYGIINWNRGSDKADTESEAWRKEEIEIEKKLQV